jgi:hypothetical protein
VARSHRRRTGYLGERVSLAAAILDGQRAPCIDVHPWRREVPGACELVLLQLLDEDGEGRPAVAGAGRWIHESDVERRTAGVACVDLGPVRRASRCHRQGSGSQRGRDPAFPVEAPQERPPFSLAPEILSRCPGSQLPAAQWGRPRSCSQSFPRVSTQNVKREPSRPGPTSAAAFAYCWSRAATRRLSDAGVRHCAERPFRPPGLHVSARALTDGARDAPVNGLFEQRCVWLSSPPKEGAAPVRRRAATTPERVWRELQLRRRFANWLAIAGSW